MKLAQRATSRRGLEFQDEVEATKKLYGRAGALPGGDGLSRHDGYVALLDELPDGCGIHVATIHAINP